MAVAYELNRKTRVEQKRYSEWWYLLSQLNVFVVVVLVSLQHQFIWSWVFLQLLSVCPSVRPMQSVILRNWLFYSTPFLIRNCKNKQHKDNYLCPFVMKKKLKTTKYLTKLMNVNIKLWLCFKWVERRKFFCNFTRQLQKRKNYMERSLRHLEKLF